MLDWQFVPEPGVFDWRTGVRYRINAYTPTAADAGQTLLWERIATTLRKTVARADPLSAPMARTLAAALWQVTVFGVFELERCISSGTLTVRHGV